MPLFGKNFFFFFSFLDFPLYCISSSMILQIVYCAHVVAVMKQIHTDASTRSGSGIS